MKLSIYLTLVLADVIVGEEIFKTSDYEDLDKMNLEADILEDQLANSI